MTSVMSESDLSLLLTAERLPALRDGLRAWLAEVGATNGEREDIVLACWEATANALEHPVRATGNVRLVAERREDHIIVCVSDSGRWRDPDPAREERGLGLKLIEALMDRVQVITSSDGTRVLMCRCLSPQCR